MRKSGPVPGKRPASFLSIAAALVHTACFLLLSQAAWALPESDEGVPSLAASPEKLDLGTILCGEVVVKKITLTNRIERPLSLAAIRFTCGCTIPLITLPDGETVSPRPDGRPPICTLMPGEAAIVELEFQAHVPSGAVTHQIFFHTSDPAMPTLCVPITAEIRPAFVLEPRRFDFGRLPCRKEHAAMMIVRSTGAGPFRITGVSGLPAYLSCRYEEKEGAAAPTWQLDLTVARNAPEGRHSCLLIVAVENEKIRSLKIPVSMRIEPRITFITAGGGDTINLGVLRQGEEAYAEVDIFNLDPEVPYEIDEIGVESAHRDYLETRLHTLEAGKRYKVTLRVKPGIPVRFFRGRIFILSSHADLKRKEIPFKGWVSLSKSEKNGKESP